MERLVNILIIDDNVIDMNALKEIINSPGNILLQCESIQEAYAILQRKPVGIILLNIDSPRFSSLNDLQNLAQSFPNQSFYTIIITENTRSGTKLIHGFKYGAVDFVSKPFNPFLIQAKIDIYKKMFFKDQRIAQLLGNIFPSTVLEELNQNGRFAPRRVENGVVLFTDFVDFSLKAKNIKPIALLHKLEHYFTRFDEIIEQYKLEKIKTIGDAYMALAGVNDQFPEPVLRACLAAIELREFVRNEKAIALATKKEFWEIRIGIHVGPLVSGVIGSKRFSFDVWGDTVNIAARAQQMSNIDAITITEEVNSSIVDYIKTIPLGEVEIVKRGGSVRMHELKEIHEEFALNERKVHANVKLREKCQLSSFDFDRMRIDIVNKLKAMLPEDLIFHDVQHSLNVEKAVIRLAGLEGLSTEETQMVRTAALYHSSGYIFSYQNNKNHAVNFAQFNLPKFGYSSQQITQIKEMILALEHDNNPKNILEEILRDADSDHLGRADYFAVISRLRDEISIFDSPMTDSEWFNSQREYMEESHEFFTDSALNLRSRGKRNRIVELKQRINPQGL